ncbi:hemolysin III family protein [Thermoproteota archaeon]
MNQKERVQSHAEELANSIVHGAGIFLSVVGLAVAVVFASFTKDPWKIVSVSIHGSSLVALYSTSTLYHSIRSERLKYIFRIIDHCAIYFVIAGSYTPFTLVVLRGVWGWSLFGVIWALAIAGIFLKVFFKRRRFRMFSTAIYLVMGWLCVIAIGPLVARLPIGGVIWLVTGGIFYTFGVVFYLWQRIPFHHSIWHLFVLAGSISHYFAVLFYVVPM